MVTRSMSEDGTLAGERSFLALMKSMHTKFPNLTASQSLFVHQVCIFATSEIPGLKVEFDEEVFSEYVSKAFA
jgi:hypothetical protein